MGRGKNRGSWARAGKKLGADVFVDLDTGQVKHVGTELTDGNAPKVYDGQPSVLGKATGSFLQTMLGTTPRDEGTGPDITIVVQQNNR